MPSGTGQRTRVAIHRERSSPVALPAVAVGEAPRRPIGWRPKLPTLHGSKRGSTETLSKQGPAESLRMPRMGSKRGATQASAESSGKKQ